MAGYFASLNIFKGEVFADFAVFGVTVKIVSLQYLDLQYSPIYFGVFANP